jgi:hypothetical protein
MEILPSVRGRKRAACLSRVAQASFEQSSGAPPLMTSLTTRLANRWRIPGRSYLKHFRTLSCSGPRFEFSSTIHVDKSFGP